MSKIYIVCPLSKDTISRTICFDMLKDIFFIKLKERKIKFSNKISHRFFFFRNLVRTSVNGKFPASKFPGFKGSYFIFWGSIKIQSTEPLDIVSVLKQKHTIIAATESCNHTCSNLSEPIKNATLDSKAVILQEEHKWNFIKANLTCHFPGFVSLN
jgi:hypothetical protein